MFGEKRAEIDYLKSQVSELNKEKWELKREIWKLEDKIIALGKLCGYEIVHQEEKDVWNPLMKK